MLYIIVGIASSQGFGYCHASGIALLPNPSTFAFKRACSGTEIRRPTDSDAIGKQQSLFWQTKTMRYNLVVSLKQQMLMIRSVIADVETPAHVYACSDFPMLRKHMQSDDSALQYLHAFCRRYSTFVFVGDFFFYTV